MNERNRYDMLRQANPYIPINGYRMFSEIQTGNIFAVSLSSRNRQRHVFAEFEDLADMDGIIKIVAF